MNKEELKIKLYIQALNKLRTNKRQRAFTKMVRVLTA